MVQEGFGWTNGVMLYLLSNYGDIIDSKDKSIYNYYINDDTNKFWLFLWLSLTFGFVAFLIHFLKKKRFHVILIPAAALSNMFKYYRL